MDHLSTARSRNIRHKAGIREVSKRHFGGKKGGANSPEERNFSLISVRPPLLVQLGKGFAAILSYFTKQILAVDCMQPPTEERDRL